MTETPFREFIIKFTFDFEEASILSYIIQLHKILLQIEQYRMIPDRLNVFPTLSGVHVDAWFFGFAHSSDDIGAIE